jgi:hypothetical protein
VAATGDGPFLLNGKWVLWFDGALSSGRRSQANDWAKNMKRIGDFASVEEFWVPPRPAATAPTARRPPERNHPSARRLPRAPERRPLAGHRELRAAAEQAAGRLQLPPLPRGDHAHVGGAARPRPPRARPAPAPPAARAG